MEPLLDGADAVVHLAARPGAAASFGDPLSCSDVNVTGTAAILEAAARREVHRIVFASLE